MRTQRKEKFDNCMLQLPELCWRDCREETKDWRRTERESTRFKKRKRRKAIRRVRCDLGGGREGGAQVESGQRR